MTRSRWTMLVTTAMAVLVAGCSTLELSTGEDEDGRPAATEGDQDGTDGAAPSFETQLTRDILVSPRGRVGATAASAAGQEGSGEVTITVEGMRDESLSLPSELQVSILPCDGVTLDLSGVLMSDVDTDGRADDLGSTARDHARIVRVNGDEVRDDRESWPLSTAVTNPSFTLTADGPDCAMAVVWIDRDDNGVLAVDGSAITERFGAVEVTWRAADEAEGDSDGE